MQVARDTRSSSSTHTQERSVARKTEFTNPVPPERYRSPPTTYKPPRTPPPTESHHPGGKKKKVKPLLQLRLHGKTSNLLLSLEVVKEDRALLGLLTPVLNDDARAVDDLAGVTLTVELAYTTNPN